MPTGNEGKLMKKLLIAALSLTFLAWAPTNGNMPSSAHILATSGKPIPTSFTTILPGFIPVNANLASVGSSTQSVAINGASGNNYSHLMVLNNTGSSVALSLSPYVSPFITPGDNGSSVLYVLPNTNAAWDDITVFDRVYVRSFSGSTITSGSVTFMVW